jgi:predicted nucleic acid-binding protein
MIVLDTNVISALMRPKLHPEIIAWQDRQPRSSIWTTAISILEARSGIYLLPMGRRREDLNAGLNALLAQAIMGRVLAFDLDAAEMSAAIIAKRIPQGRNIGTRDTQIAGIVMSRNATLATRNTRDFDDLDIALANPWED